MTEILVFVPGILGSELWKGEEKVWPGTGLEAIGGYSDQRFQDLLRDDLKARDIVRAAVGGLVGVYRNWINAFEAIVRNGNKLFIENPLGGTARTLYPFPYDWRINLETVADRFADFLDAIIAQTPDADLKLACHSLGGLLGRYYLESGHFNLRPAYGRISLFVTLGTPHNGAPIAYAGVAGLHKTNFLSIEQSKILANDMRYPSLFQIIPPSTHPFIWGGGSAERYKTYAADDQALVQAFKLNPANIAAWRGFRQGLTGNRPPHVRYFYIVGTRHTTLTRLVRNGVNLTKDEKEYAGDGTVWLPGAMDTSIQTEFVTGSHVELIDSRPARQTFARLFGADTLLSADELAQKITLSVRDIVVAPDDDIYVSIEFDPVVDSFEGTLRLQRAAIGAEGNGVEPGSFTDFQGGVPRSLKLIGPSMGNVTLKIPPTTMRGVYRPALSPDGKPESERIFGATFVVQESG